MIYYINNCYIAQVAIYGQQFSDYTEDNPKNWRNGFVVLTFKNSTLLWPEIVHVIAPGEVEFRGEIITV